MVKQLHVLFFICTVCPVHAQVNSNDVAGSYEVNLGDTGTHTINYSLKLNVDGTFEFQASDKTKPSSREKNWSPVRHTFGRGKWAIDKKSVSFSTSPTDFDEKFTLDFNNSKARFISKSPRDKTDRELKTELLFYESDLFWIEGLQIFKIN